MNKSETVKSIEAMKIFHETQMDNIKLLLNGKVVDKLEPIAKTECEFGEWLYTHENRIQDILGVQFYERLEKLHEQWHIQYYKIYKIFFMDEKKGFFSSLIGGSKVDQMQIDKAILYFTELKIISDELLLALASSHRRALALNESKFF